MTDPIVMLGVTKVVEVAFDLFMAGLERSAIVNKVRTMEVEGKTSDEITDELIFMRRASEAKAQADIDKMPD